MNNIEIAHDIQARKTEAGTWQIKHPGRDGRMTNWYSTGIEGSERQLREHVKEAKLEDIVALGKRNALSEKALAQFQRGTSRRATLESLLPECQEWMVRVGKAPRTIESVMQNLRKWIKEGKLGDKNPMNVDYKDIFPFVNPEGSALKSKSRSLRLFAVRTLYEYLIANNYCAGNPAMIVKVNNDMMRHAAKEKRRIEAFTKAEYNRLRKHLDREINDIEKYIRKGEKPPRIHKPASRLNWLRFYRFAITISWEIGLRLGDICQLEWDCFAEDGHIAVHTDKRDTRISVPVSEALQKEIDRLPTDDLDYLFPVQRELILSKNRSRPSEYFRKEVQACGIEGKSFHALRHSCIQRMKRELTFEHEFSHEEALRQIGKVVAHANPKTTEGYL